MKTYRVYSAYRNEVGGIEGAGTGSETVEAMTAEDAARDYYDGWDVDEDSVIIATDDDGDSVHYYPAEDVCR